MNTFKRNSVYAAVLAGLGAVGAVGTAEAVYVSADNTGQALIYPYFSVRAAKGVSGRNYDTYISITNSTSQTKAVKVRFLEGRRSAEVLDFNLWMSPFDMWTGAIVNSTTSVANATLVSTDKSCVVPISLFTGGVDSSNGIPFNAFKNYQFINATGGSNDGSDASLDRTREGHFEVIEMGVVTDVGLTAAAKHNSAGIPANCSAIQGQEAQGTGLNNPLAAPSGGLFGGATLINVVNGTSFSYDAVPLDNWSNVAQYFAPGSTSPNITSAAPAISRLFTGNQTVDSVWASPKDAVSAVLMANTIANEFITEATTASTTDWVVSFPTKFSHIAVQMATALTAANLATRPFNTNFNNGSCDAFSFQPWDRDELSPGAAASGVLPSPLPPSGTPTINRFCWETNVLTFVPTGGSTSGLLGSSLSSSISFNTLGSGNFAAARNGWARIDFATAITSGGVNTNATGTTNPMTPVTAGSGRTTFAFPGPATVTAAVQQLYAGLPVVGFMVNDFTNLTGAVNQVGQYDGIFIHKYTRSITP